MEHAPGPGQYSVQSKFKETPYAILNSKTKRFQSIDLQDQAIND